MTERPKEEPFLDGAPPRHADVVSGSFALEDRSSAALQPSAPPPIYIAVPMPASSVPEAPPKSRLAMGVEMFKLFLWPTIICVLLFLFYRPLETIANSLALRMGEASKVEVAGVSVEFREKVIAAAGPLGETVGTLSPLAVEILLTFRSVEDEPLTHGMVHFEEDAVVGIPPAEEAVALVELQSKGLISSSEDLQSAFKWIASKPKFEDGGESADGIRWHEIPKKQRNLDRTDLRARLTAEGARARTAILATVAGMMKK